MQRTSFIIDNHQIGDSSSKIQDSLLCVSGVLEIEFIFEKNKIIIIHNGKVVMTRIIKRLKDFGYSKHEIITETIPN